MYIVRNQSEKAPWLATDLRSGAVTFSTLVQCLDECFREQLGRRLKTFGSVEAATTFIDANPTVCIGPLEICETHLSRDGMRVSVVKSLSR